jgi:WD40 repeat protein
VLNRSHRVYVQSVEAWLTNRFRLLETGQIMHQPFSQAQPPKLLELTGVFASSAAPPALPRPPSINALFPVDDYHLVVIWQTGAALLNLAQHRIGWEILCPPAERLVLHGALNSPASLLGLGAGTQLWLWDLATGTLRHTLHQKDAQAWVGSMALSPDGRLLVASEGSYPAHQVWETESGRPCQEWVFEEDIGEVSSMTFSLDGHWLAEGSHHAEVVRLWQVAQGHLWRRWECAHPLGPASPGGVLGIAFSPDGHWLACGLDGGYATGGEFDRLLRLWDVRRGEEVLGFGEQRLRDQHGLAQSWATSPVFSPDGRFLAAICSTREESRESPQREIRIWDVQSRQEATRVQTGVRGAKVLCAIQWSPTGQRLFSSGAGNIQVWDPQRSCEVLRILTPEQLPQYSLAQQPLPDPLEGIWYLPER